MYAHVQFERRGGEDALYRRYRQLRAQAGARRIIDRMLGKQGQLPSLEAMLLNRRVVGQRSGGMQTVAVAAICGSENRSHDFDRAFRPLHDTTWDRWRSVAKARQHDYMLPPVELIQIDACYVVRDGHHRISVAWAWGQPDIDAVVTVLLVAD